MIRQELRDAVRTQVDLDEVDLPDVTLDMFLREAFDRTAALDRKWPSLQTEWSVTTTDGKVTLSALDPVPAELAAVVDTSRQRRLLYYDHDFVEENFAAQTGNAEFFSMWGGELYLWPAPEDGTSYKLRGWRKPSYAWLTDGGTEADLDEKLHLAYFHYAVALTYAQQEDEVLEQVYMNRWNQHVQTVRDDITKGVQYAPVVLNGGYQQPFRYVNAEVVI